MFKLNALLVICASVFLMVGVQPAHATQTSTEIASDSRIRYYVYDSNEVFKFIGFYRYQSSIELSPDEEIISISIGDSVAWQIVPAGNRMFLKPIEQDATTNMTVITDKRIYLFELHAEVSKGIDDESMVFVARFVYPEANGGVGTGFYEDVSGKGVPDALDFELNKGLYNFNYSVTGAMEIAPLKAFDDGEFTYIKFRDKNGTIPAIFKVNKYGRESLINYRMSGDYLVLETVGQQFTLRYGDTVACLFNEADPLKLEKEPKKKSGRFGF